MDIDYANGEETHISEHVPWDCYRARFAGLG